jgi:threonine dehydratase
VEGDARGWDDHTVSAVRTLTVPDAAELARARSIVQRHLTPTPLVASTALGATVYLKLETLQPTGSFKVRGALAALASSDGPVVTASAGNHGLGVAWAARRLGVDARIVVPETVSRAKLAALRGVGANVILHGSCYDDAEALALADGGNARYVSAYNDTRVIAGQATLGAELASAIDGPLCVVVPISGGGLISGVALWARAYGAARVVGVEAAASRQMSAAVAAGGDTVPVEIAPTIADGLAGNLEPGSITARIVADTVQEIVAVDEDELRAAMCALALDAGVIAEGAGAAAGAAVLSGRITPRPDETTVVVVSGRNVTAERLCDVLLSGRQPVDGAAP